MQQWGGSAKNSGRKGFYLILRARGSDLDPARNAWWAAEEGFCAFFVRDGAFYEMYNKSASVRRADAQRLQARSQGSKSASDRSCSV